MRNDKMVPHRFWCQLRVNFDAAAPLSRIGWLRPVLFATSLLPVPAAHAAPPSPAPLAWSAAPTVETVSEAKTFRNGETMLSGTLTLPKSGKPVGAVVVTHTASKPSRDAAIYRHLVEMLPAMGIAVFVYDRRGSGQSGGDLKASDYPMLADDAIAAVKMLEADKRIDPKRVGIWGLSQGGWLSLLAATRSSDVDFVVSIAAPLVSPDVQMLFRSESVLRINGYPDADVGQMRAARLAVDGYMRGTGTREEAQKRVDAIKAKPWFRDMYIAETVGDRATSRWRKEIEYDPLPTLDAVKEPALILYGGADPVVPVDISVARIAAKKRPGIATHVVAGADHHMSLTMSPTDQMDQVKSANAAPDAAEYFAVLARWLTERGIAARSGR